MAARSERARGFLRGLSRFVVLIAVAGGLGAALGAGLVALAGDTGPATTVSGTDRTSETTAIAPSALPPLSVATASTVTAPPPAGTVPAAPPATTTVPGGRLDRVGVRILGAILHPAGTPDGVRRRRSRLTMRVRAINRAGTPLTIPTPVLAVGSVRIRTDPAAETPATRFGELAVAETRAVTLRFELQGEATEKITIDRRARLYVAGRWQAFRLKVGPPVVPPASAGTDAATQTTP